MAKRPSPTTKIKNGKIAFAGKKMGCNKIIIIEKIISPMPRGVSRVCIRSKIIGGWSLIAFHKYPIA
jgi:hypothetical protein